MAEVSKVNLGMNRPEEVPPDYFTNRAQIRTEVLADCLIEMFGKHQRPRTLKELDSWHQRLWVHRAKTILKALGE